MAFANLCDRELLVLADSQRLLQVFVNLLGNARDACDEYGQVRILAHSDGTRVNIAVEDDGCGIPPDQLSHVRVTTPPGPGLGHRARPGAGVQHHGGHGRHGNRHQPLQQGLPIQAPA